MKPVIEIGTGIGDRTHDLLQLTEDWEAHVNVHAFGWNGHEREYAPRKAAYFEMIRERHEQFGQPINLIGISASSSAALNATVELGDIIRKVVILGGRLREGDGWAIPYHLLKIKNPIFAESVRESQKNLERLQGREKDIMTIRPRWDELVPGFTVEIPGAQNIVLNSIGHASGTKYALRSCRAIILDFINS